MKNKKLCRLKARVLKAEYALHEAIIEAFPVGSMFDCHKGRGCVRVMMVDHNGDEVRVRNPLSGKVYHVGFYYLHACQGCKTDKCYKDAEKGRG